MGWVPYWKRNLIRESRDILTIREARAIKVEEKEFKSHGVSSNWPEPWTPPRKIECRLLFNKYMSDSADSRCEELHGDTFDGRYASGRYWVYYSEEQECISY